MKILSSQFKSGQGITFLAGFVPLTLLFLVLLLKAPSPLENTWRPIIMGIAWIEWKTIESFGWLPVQGEFREIALVLHLKTSGLWSWSFPAPKKKLKIPVSLKEPVEKLLAQYWTGQELGATGSQQSEDPTKS